MPYCSMVGREERLAPMWRNLREGIDLEELASLLDQVYLGCTRRAESTDESTIPAKTALFQRITPRKETPSNSWNALMTWQRHPPLN